jgi:hypothetical protein
MNYVILYIIIIIVLFIGLLLYKYNPKESFENKNKSDIGFIITRHVNNESVNKVWISCVKQIRKSYPNNKIVIIDDDSNYDFIKVPSNNFLNNCIVINSEYKNSGELLPYIYYAKNKWFEKAIYIHDSCMINGKIPVKNIKNVKFLFTFDSKLIFDERPYIKKFCKYLNHGDELWNLFNNKLEWKGSWGVMSCITHSYCKHLYEKYNLQILTNHVNKRVHRMAMERIFALMCFHDKAILDENSPSIYGRHENIQGNNTYTYDTYFKYLSENKILKKPVKLFFGR